MPPSRLSDPIVLAGLPKAAERATLTARMARLRGGAAPTGALPAFPFYPFAHLPVLRTDAYGARCQWCLNYPMVN